MSCLKVWVQTPMEDREAGSARPMGLGLDTTPVKSLGPQHLANVPQELGGRQRATLEEKHLWDGQWHRTPGCELWDHRWTMEEWLSATGQLRREGQLRWAVAHSASL